MQAVGLKTFIWQNNTRSALLLAGFPVLLTVLLYAGQLALIGAGEAGGDGSLAGDFQRAAVSMPATIAVAVLVSLVWFAIAWAANQGIIDAVTGARRVERREAPELYNLVENLCISRGMAVPTLRIIERDELNAFASGVQEGRFSVTVTRGLLNALTRDELEAVLAHELTHIINRDVRTMVIAAVFAGIISLLAQLIFRGLYWTGGGRRDRDNRNGGALILIALAAAAVGYGLAIVIRLALSRRREFVADAGSVELTKNPDAMISALRKVSGRSHIAVPDEVAGLFLDNEESGFAGLFATHPPIEKRIAALVRYGGGRDRGAVEASVPPMGFDTAVPETEGPPSRGSVPWS